MLFLRITDSFHSFVNKNINACLYLRLLPYGHFVEGYPIYCFFVKTK